VTLALWLRVAGGSLVLLSLFHAVLWRTLEWSKDTAKLTPLTARVFAVHTFFIAFVLAALGFLSLLEPELLVEPSRLAKVLLCGVVAFWLARLVLQALVFDKVMGRGWTRSPMVRFGAYAAWCGYVAIYGAALLSQFPGAP
jgi:small-conductance mechanosensitive channel